MSDHEWDSGDRTKFKNSSSFLVQTKTMLTRKTNELVNVTSVVIRSALVSQSAYALGKNVSAGSGASLDKILMKQVTNSLKNIHNYVCLRGYKLYSPRNQIRF